MNGRALALTPVVDADDWARRVMRTYSADNAQSVCEPFTAPVTVPRGTGKGWHRISARMSTLGSL